MASFASTVATIAPQAMRLDGGQMFLLHGFGEISQQIGLRRWIIRQRAAHQLIRPMQFGPSEKRRQLGPSEALGLAARWAISSSDGMKSTTRSRRPAFSKVEMRRRSFQQLASMHLLMYHKLRLRNTQQHEASHFIVIEDSRASLAALVSVSLAISGCRAILIFTS